MKFASGIEKASFVTSSRLLCRSWSTISSSSSSDDDEAIVSHEGVRLSWKVSTEQDSDLKIIAFKATLDALDLSGDLISSSELREENFLDFEFLCSRRYPRFSLNRTAVSLFRDNHQQLDSLRSQISSSNQVTRLIVTGHGIGGAIASLFTISLLHSIGSRKKRPLCITFGSPLVGDKKLQQAITCSSNWSSCFLHVVSHMDPVPRLYITNPTSAYMPFGTFLVCSYATSFENSDSVLEILVALGSIHDQNQGFKSVDYGNIVENLYHKAICKDFSVDAGNMSYRDSLSAGISLQLQALGLTSHMQKQKKNIDINILEIKLKELEEKSILQKRTSFDPSKKLNHMKMCMAQLEWYKKATKNRQIGYYDSYKNMNSTLDVDVVEFHVRLTIYWEEMVEEVEREGAAFRNRWLYRGTNYRRMVEPLAIAQYYRDGGEDYINKHRSKHFKQLEEWLIEGKTEATSSLNITSRKNVKAILTIDSCFWAHVEEALLSCKQLNVVKDKEEALKKLVGFEEYVYGLLNDYAVSPEIFLIHSSYMHWWNQYKAIKGSSYSSALANFMNNYKNIEQYAEGVYDFS